MTCTRLTALMAFALLILGGCSLGADEPLAPGTFEVTVTGDATGSATGTAFVAAPDSGLNVTTGVWTVDIPIQFSSSFSAGDAVEVRLAVIEPTQPNGPFTSLPAGTINVDKISGNPAEPLARAVFRTAHLDVSATDGTLTLRPVDDGVEGTLRARYVEAQFNGQVFRGQVELRFYALGAPPARP